MKLMNPTRKKRGLKLLTVKTTGKILIVNQVPRKSLSVFIKLMSQEHFSKLGSENRRKKINPQQLSRKIFLVEVGVRGSKLSLP